jgi:hypothetical protein
MCSAYSPASKSWTHDWVPGQYPHLQYIAVATSTLSPWLVGAFGMDALGPVRLTTERTEDPL